MNNKPTPETDAARITEKNGCIATFGAREIVSVNFARKLERERDWAREGLEAMKRVGVEQARRADANREWALRTERERDEAREQLSASKHFLEKYIAERDEAIAEIQKLRYDAQREAEHHDCMVKELEGLYDKFKS